MIQLYAYLDSIDYQYSLVEGIGNDISKDEISYLIGNHFRFLKTKGKKSLDNNDLLIVSDTKLDTGKIIRLIFELYWIPEWSINDNEEIRDQLKWFDIQMIEIALENFRTSDGKVLLPDIGQYYKVTPKNPNPNRRSSYFKVRWKNKLKAMINLYTSECYLQECSIPRASMPGNSKFYDFVFEIDEEARVFQEKKVLRFLRELPSVSESKEQ